jgi:hypothetical protein
VPIGDEKQTLPRLELLSSLLAATLGDYVIKAAKGHTFKKITCFSDSTSAIGPTRGIQVQVVMAISFYNFP